MKIKTKALSYEQVLAKKRPKHRMPLRPMFLLQLVVRVLAILDLLPTGFAYQTHGMEKIGMMVDYKAIYMVGEGTLIHDTEGFHLTGCGGKLRYEQSPLACYSVYSDYYWYEIGDVICIGNRDALYYCFPQNCGDVVAKTRLAAEELYQLKKRRRTPVTA